MPRAAQRCSKGVACSGGPCRGMAPSALNRIHPRLASCSFVVQLAGDIERWDPAAAPIAERDRFRYSLERSTDSKVVALRQAVLEKCVAVRGPSPGQGEDLRAYPREPLKPCRGCI